MDSSTSSTDKALLSTASGGNTKTPESNDAAPASKKVQISPAKRWCFTIFKFDEDNWRNQISSMFHMFDKYVIGLEICPKTLNKHLQGFVEFKKKERPLTRFAKVFPGIHFEKTKGTVNDNIKYCSKEGDYIVQGYEVVKPFTVKEILALGDQEKVFENEYVTKTKFHDWVFMMVKERKLAYPPSINRMREVCDVAYMFGFCSGTLTVDETTRALDTMVTEPSFPTYSFAESFARNVQNWDEDDDE